MTLAAGISVFDTPAVAVALQPQDNRGQDRQDRDRDRGEQAGPDQTANSAAQVGTRHGQDDRAHNRTAQYHQRFENDADRRAYESSYDQAYRRPGANGRNNNGRYGNGGYGNNGYGNNGYGNNGQYGANDARDTASQTGSQDGRNDGMTDRRMGHSFRPTQGDNYKSGGRAYNSRFGGRTQYNQMYRQSYGPAYQQGYYR